MNIYTVVILAVGFCLPVSLFATWYLYKNVLNPQGEGAEKRTSRILSQFAALHRYSALSAVRVPDAQGGEIEIENLLLGPFGILLVSTLGHRGEFYGMLDGESWTVVQREDRRKTMENPVKLLERQEAALRGLFAREEIYRVPIHRVVHLTSNSKKTSLYVSHKGEIVAGGRLREYLGKPLFQQDKGVDVQRVKAALLGSEDKS